MRGVSKQGHRNTSFRITLKVLWDQKRSIKFPPHQFSHSATWSCRDLLNWTPYYSHQWHPVRAHRGHPTVLLWEEVHHSGQIWEPADPDVPPECPPRAWGGEQWAPVLRQVALHLHQRHHGAAQGGRGEEFKVRKYRLVLLLLGFKYWCSFFSERNSC